VAERRSHLGIATAWEIGSWSGVLMVMALFGVFQRQAAAQEPAPAQPPAEATQEPIPAPAAPADPVEPTPVPPPPLPVPPPVVPPPVPFPPPLHRVPPPPLPPGPAVYEVGPSSCPACPQTRTPTTFFGVEPPLWHKVPSAVEAVAALGVTVTCADEGGGVLVLDVVPHGPAAVAGLVRGDRILAINHQWIHSPGTLACYIHRKLPGSRIFIAYWRYGAIHSTNTVLVPKGAIPGAPPETRQVPIWQASLPAAGQTQSARPKVALIETTWR